METLAKYLKGKRKQDFANEIGIVPAYLSQILSGIKRPSFDLMVRIDAASDGQVPLASWIRRDAIDPKEAAQ